MPPTQCPSPESVVRQTASCTATSRPPASAVTTAATAAVHSHPVVATTLPATAREPIAHVATITPTRTPSAPYAPATACGAKVSGRTASRAGTAISTTVSNAPSAAARAIVSRYTTLDGALPSAGVGPVRSAPTLPSTVELAVIQVAQARLDCHP